MHFMDSIPRSMVSRIVLLCSSLVLTGCSNLTSVLFYPQNQHVRTPADIGLLYQDVELRAVDNTALHAWFLPAQTVSANKGPQVLSAQSSKPIVLFLHGNAENISTHLGSVYWLPSQGVNVLLLDYRGFGHSAGAPLIPAIFQDIEASLMWLRQRYPQQAIYILGQSIGAAIGTTSMALFHQKYAINGLILDAGLTGYRDIAQHVLAKSWFTWPVWPFTWLLPTQWDPIKHIDNITPKPLLMFHSQADKILPYREGYRLFLQANHPKQWVKSKGGHIQTFNYGEYRQTLLKFLMQ